MADNFSMIEKETMFVICSIVSATLIVVALWWNHFCRRQYLGWPSVALLIALPIVGFIGVLAPKSIAVKSKDFAVELVQIRQLEQQVRGLTKASFELAAIEKVKNFDSLERKTPDALEANTEVLRNAYGEGYPLVVKRLVLKGYLSLKPDTLRRLGISENTPASTIPTQIESMNLKRLPAWIDSNN